MSTQGGNPDALWLPVPAGNVVSVEHPCLVRNVEKAVDMIGGPAAVAQALPENSTRTFALSFHPEDPATRTIPANRMQANNILLQVSVPKRTGRKRKRGGDGSWQDSSLTNPTNKDAAYLLRSIKDNSQTYTVTARSRISSMHLWRAIPDFVFSTSQTKLVQDIKSQILSQHYPTVKEFQLPRTYGLQDTTTVPAPVWSSSAIANTYSYRQNPSVKVTSDPLTGKAIVHNPQIPSKIYSYQVQWDTPEYPSAPMPDLMPLQNQAPVFKQTVTALQKLFDERPIWTRRALLNCLESELSSFNVVRYCLAYVAFAVRSGPWRDTYIKLGVDPRKEPSYRIYQSIMLQLVPKQLAKGLATVDIDKQTYDEKGQRRDRQPRYEGAAEAGSTGPANASTQTERERLTENRYTFARFWARSNDTSSHIFDGTSPLPPDGKVWQLCDITDPQIAALRDIDPSDLRQTCDDRYFGWYLNGTNAKIRVALKAKVDGLIDGPRLDPAVLEPFLRLADNVPLARGEVDVPGSTQMNGTPSDSPDATTETASVYLGKDATKQQVEWAAMYRAYARTGIGQVPGPGAAAQSRASNAAPTMRKTRKMANKGKRKALPATGPPQEQAPLAQADTTNDPIIIEDIDPEAEAENIPAAPDLQDGEEILPSIEFNGFDVDDDGDSELGLEDSPVVKLEEENA